MAPTYRNQNRRQNRTGVVDHDILEGLPVRQWRRDYVTVAPPPIQDSTTSQNDIWAVELPHGMPKDSHLLPQHSQDLLRAARSGRIYKRPAPPEEEEADAEAILGDKPEKKEDDPKDKGFTAKAWKPIPRHMEGPDIEYLAKKRKGLVPMKANPAPVVATLTKTTVKRIDAAGNEYVQDVVVPHGQQVEGEVIAQTLIPDPSASADSFTVQPTPTKRKGGGSKKKLKGPGRGRKKKQQVAPTSVPETVHVGGTVQSGALAEGAVGPDGVKIEADANATQTDTETQTQNEDTEMGDGSMANSDEDEGDEGEDGEDGDEDEGSDAQNSPSKPSRSSPSIGSIPAIKSIPNLGLSDTIIGGTELAHPSRIFTEREKAEGRFGSPLKTVALTASTLTSPLESPTVASASDSFSAPGHQSPLAATVEHSSLDEAMKQETTKSAPTTLPPPPPAPTEVEVQTAVETRQEEEEEEMLLDIVDNANNAQIGGPEATLPAPEPETSVAAVPAEAVKVPREEEAAAEPPKEEKPGEPAPEADDDDDYPDLLGGLERSLEKK